MQEERIRRTGTNSANSVDLKQLVDVKLEQHTKVFPFDAVSDTIDQREQFETERENSTKYRLILTVNPYCTNILFNAVTEIVQNEGSVTDTELKIADGSEGINLNAEDLGGGYAIKGQLTNLTNTQMVRNTEYSNGDKPFVYHCGFDIFNNHILRNQSFKLVCDYQKLPRIKVTESGSSKYINVYNTIRDYMRYENGQAIELTRRISVDNIDTKKQYRHLYLKEDILSLEDSINANLFEQNGWYGFNNRSSIPTCEYKKSEGWKDLKIAKVFNGKNMGTIEESDRMACEFIEMYPDSSLYSFSPKYNKFQNREEHNWDICITYPYENDEGKLLVHCNLRSGEYKFYKWNATSSGKYIYDEITFVEVIEQEEIPTENVGEYIKVDGNFYEWTGTRYIQITVVENGVSPSEMNDTYIKVDEYYYKRNNSGKYDSITFVTKGDVPATNEGDYIQVGNDYYKWSEYNNKYNPITVAEKNEYIMVENPGDEFNALALCSYEQTNGLSGQPIIMFRSYVKHNLKRGDYVKLSYCKKNVEGKGLFTEINDKIFNVVNVGDLNGNNREYYFYINDVADLLQEIGEVDGVIDNDYIFRFNKIVNGRACKYYYRKFKKLPNFRIKQTELTDEIAQDKDKFEEYVNENCKKDDKMLLFNREQYPLAFSKTIYGDGNTQIVFTDSIDIDKIRDNLGRPLTELYMTFIKRNRGHDVWYKKDKEEKDLKEIEFSHCFGEIISGLTMYRAKDDDAETLQNRKVLGDVTCLCKNIVFDVESDSNTLITEGTPLDVDIDIDKTDEFYGDVVELDRNTMIETVLGDVYFRFNTEQREHLFGDKSELNCGTFIYDEIETDDYDTAGFVCEAINADGLEENVLPTTFRREGYCYKAHYPIQVREFGAIRQGSHKEIKVSKCQPRQANGLFIEVVSTLRSGADNGSVIYLYNRETGKKLNEFTVNSVVNNVRFLLNPLKIGSENYMSIYEVVDGLLFSERDLAPGDEWTDENGIEHIAKDMINVKDYSRPKYIIRLKNTDIPSYAYEVGNNIFLWRDVLNVGNKDTVTLKEYPFANGHFYINQDINFYLKRQDPFNENHLQSYDTKPNDIYGNVQKQSIYEYNDETNFVC